MNASYEWLRSMVPFEQSPAELRDLITSHTATVDELVALRQDLAPIVVARVVESERIPDTKLSANKVDAGTGELLDVVCGAPNVTVGSLYPFAPTGTTMPGGLKIERRKIRGAVSNGMLCSARELGLGVDHEGIMELAVDAAPGTPFLSVLPAGDSRLVIDVLANRPDLLSHRGIARELAIVTGKPLALPAIEGAPGSLATARRADGSGETGGTRVRLDEGGTLARRYMGVVIRGVKVAPSPAWLVERLEAVGSRSINNVVDATNYVLWELGQPTHAFDLARLEGNTVMVRRARPNESLVTLDGAERRLDESMTVIGDAMHAIAIAGVMGGRDSEVTEATTDVFLEVASFDPARTRATRRRLGLSTDASYRFERGVDPEMAAEALDRCARLIIATAGGSIAGAPLDLYPSPPAPRIASMRAARVARVLGTPVPMDKAARILRALGCTVKPAGNDTVEVTAPSWRTDLVEEIDLIEEVARLHGYAAIPSELRGGRPSAVPDDPQWLVSDRVRSALVSAGLLEVRPLPFVPGGEGYVRVTNPLAENEGFLRRDVLETLARRAEHNLARMQGNVRIFEVGAAFQPRSGALPAEELRVACLLMGDRDPSHFTAPRPPAIDEWDAKWIAGIVLEAALGGPGGEVRQAESGEDGRLWDLVVGGEVRGHVSSLVLDAPVWAAPAFGVELSLGVVPSADVAPAGSNAHADSVAGAPERRFAPFKGLPATPAAEFDLALLVRDDQRADAVEAVIRRAAGDLLEAVTVFDAYTGKGVPAGYRSLAWRLVLRHPERTLRDKEIDGRRAKILSTLETELDVRQRAT